MFTKHRSIAILAVSLSTLAAPPVRAQEAPEDPRAGRREREARDAGMEAAIERLRRDLDRLERQRLDAVTAMPDVRRDSVLRALQPAMAAAARRLAAIQARLAWQRADMTASRPAPAHVPASPRASAPPAAVSVAEPPEGQPRGWVGLNFSGATRISSSRAGLVIYHYDYPVVESVEPASPAERAGLQAGDTVIAYDGRDVLRREISIGRQLRPGARLLVRVRRDGQTRDVPVRVERRPDGFATYYAVAPAAPAAPVFPLAPRVAPAPPAPPAPPSPLPPRRRQQLTVEVEVPDVLALEPLPPAAAPLAALPALGAIFGGGRPMVAGAEVTAMGPELREVFGATGVLVLSVAQGSPAAQSGLRAGDVIHRLNGAAVASPQALQRAVARYAVDREARLDVVRRKRSERLTLRW